MQTHHFATPCHNGSGLNCSCSRSWKMRGSSRSAAAKFGSLSTNTVRRWDFTNVWGFGAPSTTNRFSPRDSYSPRHRAKSLSSLARTSMCAGPLRVPVRGSVRLYTSQDFTICAAPRIHAGILAESCPISRRRRFIMSQIIDLMALPTGFQPVLRLVHCPPSISSSAGWFRPGAGS